MKLTISLENEIPFLERYRVTPTELFLVRVLLILQDENNEELFSSYIRTLKNAGVTLRDLFLSLQEKGVILKSFEIPKKGESFDPYAIQINKNFIKNLYKCSFELGKELFEVYPMFGTVQGNVVGLRSVSKKFDSLEDAYFKYGKAIKWNPDTHKHIIELIKWANEHQIINYTLANFIVDQRWLELEALRDGDLTNINYDTVKML